MCKPPRISHVSGWAAVSTREEPLIRSMTSPDVVRSHRQSAGDHTGGISSPLWSYHIHSNKHDIDCAQLVLANLQLALNLYTHTHRLICQQGTL